MIRLDNVSGPDTVKRRSILKVGKYLAKATRIRVVQATSFRSMRRSPTSICALNLIAGASSGAPSSISLSMSGAVSLSAFTSDSKDLLAMVQGQETNDTPAQ